MPLKTTPHDGKYPNTVWVVTLDNGVTKLHKDERSARKYARRVLDDWIVIDPRAIETGTWEQRRKAVGHRTLDLCRLKGDAAKRLWAGWALREGYEDAK